MSAFRNNLWDMEALQRELHSAFENLTREFSNDRWSLPFSRVSFLPARSARMYPLLNISEDDNNFYVEALAPGIDPDSMEIKIIDNQLQITGTKQGVGKDIKPEAYHRSERGAGKFIRSLHLPSQVDVDNVKADYTNGLLRVTVAKAEKAKPRMISVSVN